MLFVFLGGPQSQEYNFSYLDLTFLGHSYTQAVSRSEQNDFFSNIGGESFPCQFFAS